MNELDEGADEKENGDDVGRGFGAEKDMEREYGEQGGGPEGVAVRMGVLADERGDGGDGERAEEDGPEFQGEFVRPEEPDGGDAEQDVEAVGSGMGREVGDEQETGAKGVNEEMAFVVVENPARDVVGAKEQAEEDDGGERAEIPGRGGFLVGHGFTETGSGVFSRSFVGGDGSWQASEFSRTGILSHRDRRAHRGGKLSVLHR